MVRPEKNARYMPLSTAESEETECEKCIDHAVAESRRPPFPTQRLLWLIHLFLVVLWALGVSALISQSRFTLQHSDPDETSPLRNTLKYHPVKFSTGLNGDKTKYQGPPDDTNGAAWDQLTNTGIVALTSEEQQRLHDTSAVFETKDGESTYLGAIEVFHQLHCLDMLRLEVYGNLTEWLHEHHSTRDKLEHLDHCIDYLRRSLMCRPSIEILPFGVDEATGSFRARFDGTHTCTEFRAVKGWAVERRAGNLTPQ